METRLRVASLLGILVMTLSAHTGWAAPVPSLPPSPPPLEPIEQLAVPPVDEFSKRAVERQDIASLPRRTWTVNPGPTDLVTLRPIFFAPDSAGLDERARALIARTIRYIESHASSVRRILIRAHCDETASTDYNYRLARRRAEAVRAAFLAARLREDLFGIQSLGETMPVDEYWRPSGRRHNRRVEIHILLRHETDRSNRS